MVEVSEGVREEAVVVVGMVVSEGWGSMVVVLDDGVGVFWVIVRVSVASADRDGGCGVEGSESEYSSQAISSSGAVVAPVEVFGEFSAHGCELGIEEWVKLTFQ